MTSVEQIAERFTHRTVARWKNIDLTVDEQTFIRDKPRDYLLACIELCKLIDAKTIIEIGSMRQGLSHPLDYFNPYCCNDGHSTAFWSWFLGENTSIYSVDIDPLSGFVALYRGVSFFSGDGIDFVRNFDGIIDMLFLDAWDVVEGIPFAEKHLECYEVARSKLAPRHIICIDDIDVGDGGKGKLLIPRLIEYGYFEIANGRQAIFTNFME